MVGLLEGRRLFLIALPFVGFSSSMLAQGKPPSMQLPFNSFLFVWFKGGLISILVGFRSGVGLVHSSRLQLQCTLHKGCGSYLCLSITRCLLKTATFVPRPKKSPNLIIDQGSK